MVCCLYVLLMLLGIRKWVGAGLAYNAVLGLVGWGLLWVLSRRDRFVLCGMRGSARERIIAVCVVVVAWIVRVGLLHHAAGRSLLRVGIFLVCVAAVEEGCFRGFIWNRLEDATGSRGWALVLSTVLFTMMHLPNWIVFHNVSPVQVGFTVLWGLVFGLVRLVSHGLVLPIAVHAAVDMIG